MKLAQICRNPFGVSPPKCGRNCGSTIDIQTVSSSTSRLREHIWNYRLSPLHRTYSLGIANYGLDIARVVVTPVISLATKTFNVERKFVGIIPKWSMEIILVMNPHVTKEVIFGNRYLGGILVSHFSSCASIRVLIFLFLL